MKYLFKKICLPLLHINNNVYTFFSGITVSLATNIFTTICIDDYAFSTQWNLYISIVSFALLSGMLLYVASKMSGFQEFANSPNDEFDDQTKETIIYEATEENYKQWLKRYFFVAVFLAIGIVFLAVDFPSLSCSTMLNYNKK